MKTDFIAEMASITMNFNMGFLNRKEYYCQRAYIHLKFGGHLYQYLWWKILSITPKLVFKLF